MRISQGVSEILRGHEIIMDGLRDRQDDQYRASTDFVLWGPKNCKGTENGLLGFSLSGKTKTSITGFPYQQMLYWYMTLCLLLAL